MPGYFALPITQSTFTASAYRNPTWGKKRKRSPSTSPNPDATTDADNSEQDTAADDDGPPQWTQGPRHLNLKQTHFTLLNTLLHRALHSGDHARASRAFALLLRTRFGGATPRVRAHGLWGIGVEILLHRGAAADPEAAAAMPDCPFAEPAFADAVALLERLIQQHPWTRFREARDISSLHFYPVLFGLWVYQVDGRSRYARWRRRQQQQQQQQQERRNERELHDQDGAATQETASEIDAEEKKIQATELASAREIAARIERVTAGPPFDRDPALQRIRGMVALWIAELLAEGDRAVGLGTDAGVDLSAGDRAGEAGWDAANGTNFEEEREGAEQGTTEIDTLQETARDAFRRAQWKYPRAWNRLGSGGDGRDGLEPVEL